MKFSKELHNHDHNTIVTFKLASKYKPIVCALKNYNLNLRFYIIHSIRNKDRTFGRLLFDKECYRRKCQYKEDKKIRRTWYFKIISFYTFVSISENNFYTSYFVNKFEIYTLIFFKIATKNKNKIILTTSSCQSFNGKLVHGYLVTIQAAAAEYCNRNDYYQSAETQTSQDAKLYRSSFSY